MFVLTFAVLQFAILMTIRYENLYTFQRRSKRKDGDERKQNVKHKASQMINADYRRLLERCFVCVLVCFVCLFFLFVSAVFSLTKSVILTRKICFSGGIPQVNSRDIG